MKLNKVYLVGNLTRLPEMRATPSGMSVSSFSVATNRNWTDKQGERQQQTEFHSVVAFGRQAEVINQYCTKGSLILVEGCLQTRSWEKEGQKYYRTEIIVENFQLGSRPKVDKEEADDHDQPSTDIEPVIQEDEVDPDEIPF
jgi:single-strand DNA-binding protein